MTTVNIGAVPSPAGSNRAAREAVTRRAIIPTLRWAAVLAGVAAGLSVQLLLAMLGLASGLSVATATEGVSPGAGTLLWSVISMLGAALVGSYVAGRVSGLNRKADGILHGIITWSVSMLLFITMATSVGGALLSGIFYDIGQNSPATGQTSSVSGLVGMLNRQIGTNLSTQELQTLQEDILNGKRDIAISFLSARSGLKSDRATAIVDQALILSGQPLLASAEARATADRAIKGASLVAWSVFAATALSLAASLFGGMFGATTATRLSWEEAGSGVKSVS